MTREEEKMTISWRDFCGLVLRKDGDGWSGALAGSLPSCIRGEVQVKAVGKEGDKIGDGSTP